MANTILTPTAVTRGALAILHQKLNFVGNINRQYDDRFANSGASPSGKLGPSLQIRLPNQFTVRSGLVMAAKSCLFCAFHQAMARTKLRSLGSSPRVATPARPTPSALIQPRLVKRPESHIRPEAMATAAAIFGTASPT